MRQRIVLGVFAAVLLFGSVAQAQEVITATLANIQQRQRDPETIITPSIQRTQIPPVNGEWFRVRLTMSQNDVTDPTRTWSLLLEEFIPGIGWKFVTGGPFQGGVRIDPDSGLQQYPSITFHPSQLSQGATEVRFQISIPVRMSIGAVIETFRDQ
jgi:hypothetical protein